MDRVARFLAILPGERGRVAMLALLLFINSMILESNEVVATSGFVSRVGVESILWVWAADMLIIILTSAAYSLVVDRTRRGQLGVRLFVGFSLVYVALYSLFRLGAPDWLLYSLLTVLNDQQWILLPMLIWALGNDLFSTSEAKRLFPLLAMAAFAGALFGNGVTAATARWVAEGERGSIDLLLGNATLLALMAVVLAVAMRRIGITTRQSRHDEQVLDALREGAAFVREVPAYRYLALAMVLLAMGLNAIEYQFIVAAAQSYSPTANLETFYALVRAARICIMVVVQGVAAGWLLRQLGFRSIFAVMPVALLAGLILTFFWPTLVGLVIAQYLARTALEGVDEPARRAFVGLVPDERRGRVGAFLDGYLYPLGSILSCGMIGAVLLAVGQRLLPADAGRALYSGVAILCTMGALWALRCFRATYDTSMLNWRLKRRRRGSALANLEF